MNTETFVFFAYLLAMVIVGVVFFIRSKGDGEKEYFLGGRQMGPWVTALSAGASDMSAWVLMGLPTAIYLNGLSECWIAVGLGVGYSLSWLFEAPRLRAFSIVCGDAITIPQYLSKRFLSKSHLLQAVCAVVFLIAYTIYAASSIKACGNLFHTVMNIDEKSAMVIAAVVIVSYTFLGGFSAVCWTDFFQGMLMLGGMLIAPIFASFMLQRVADPQLPATFWNATASWKSIASGFGWGLGYFGMPHIIIRFMSLNSQKDMRKSAVIGIGWTTFILIFAVIIGILGRHCMGLDEEIASKELVFVSMVRRIFPALISGVLLSAILAAAMSTADSQLLSASSSFSSDIYKPVVRSNKASDYEILWIGRIVVLIIAVIAMLLALNPKSGSIMGLVSNAWGVFGAAFGPAILLSLFWKRLSYAGAVAGIIAGAGVDIIWMLKPLCSGLYEIIPGFAAGLVVAVVVSLIASGTAEQRAKLSELFDKAVRYRE